MTDSQELSADGLYEYTWRRTWGPGPQALFVMLNPSRDELTGPPNRTLGRIQGFATDAGAGGFVTANIFAWRATRPEELREAADPVGVENEHYLNRLIGEATATGAPVVAAWGSSWRTALPGHAGRMHEMTERLRAAGAQCLGHTKVHRDPRHPLYVPADTPLEEL